MISMEKDITRIFLECQTSSASHPKLIKKLLSIYLKSDFKSFCDKFTSLTKYSLIHEDKHPCVERTLDFLAKFSASLKSEEQELTERKNGTEDEDIEIDPFLVAIFEFLLKNHEANSRAVRYRVCQLINKILNSMGEEASIDDHLYSSIYDTMLQRLMDKVPSIRVQAVLALSRLQDPRNKECPVIKAYLFHLSMDPNPDVRKAILNSIPITFQTLPDILERIRDTSDAVRRQAYIILAQKVHIRAFTIAQRIQIVTEGLNDRSQKVQQAVKKNVLQAWLRLVNGNILDLLKCLDVETSTDSAELALASLFEGVPIPTLLENFTILNERKIIPLDDLTSEAALYWKCLAKHLRSEKADEYLDEILPDLTVFCDYIKDYIMRDPPADEDPQDTAVRLMEKDFVSLQLITLTSVFDLSDEVGRKRLCKIVQQLFHTVPISEVCIKSLSKVFALLYPPSIRVDHLAEIISDIRECTEAPQLQEKEEIAPTPKPPKETEEQERKRKIKIAQISVKMNQIREDLEDCVRNLDLGRAMTLKDTLKDLEEEKEKVLEGSSNVTPLSTPVIPCSQAKMPDDDEEIKLRDDPETLARCLLILCEFLSQSDVTNFGSILRSFHDNLILPCLKSEDVNVRRTAVRGLALTCLISKELAQQHLLLLVQISQMDVEEIQVEALQGLFDIWLYYGIEPFESTTEDVNELPAFSDSQNLTDHGSGPSESEMPAVGNMMLLLTKMLETESKEARTLSAEGLSKLLLAGRITSSKLLSQLIILWYNPATEEDHMLRHMLGVFFPLYASHGGSNQQSICGALLPVIHTIFNASARSPLIDIDVEDVVNFMISITSPAIVSNKSDLINAHDSLVFTLCAEILAFPDRDYTRALIRGLNHLVLSPKNFTTLRQIACLIQKIKDKIVERSLCNNIEKFDQSIKSMLQFAPKPEDENDEDSINDVKTNDQTDSTLTLPSRRKRVLYNTLNDLELVSDLDSETETPSKVKRISESNKIISSTSVINKVLDSDDDDNSEDVHQTNTETKEIELSCDDLIGDPKNVRTSPLPGSEGETNMFASSDTSGNESPPRKSPRIRRFQTRSTERRRKVVKVINVDSESSPLHLCSTMNTLTHSKKDSSLPSRGESSGLVRDVKDKGSDRERGLRLSRTLQLQLKKLSIDGGSSHSQDALRSVAAGVLQDKETKRTTRSSVSSSSSSTDHEVKYGKKRSRRSKSESESHKNKSDSSNSPHRRTRSSRKHTETPSSTQSTPRALTQRMGKSMDTTSSSSSSPLPMKRSERSSRHKVALPARTVRSRSSSNTKHQLSQEGSTRPKEERLRTRSSRNSSSSQDESSHGS